MTTPIHAEALNALDRCDRCGAQAYVRFERADITLVTGSARIDMCAHHTREHKDAVLAQGFTVIVDERERLDEGNRQKGEVHA